MASPKACCRTEESGRNVPESFQWTEEGNKTKTKRRSVENTASQNICRKEANPAGGGGTRGTAGEREEARGRRSQV